MNKSYFRPVLVSRTHASGRAKRLAGGWLFFDHVDVVSRKGVDRISAGDLPSDVEYRLTQSRPQLGICAFDTPQIMGILNVTPDSFSDGGQAVTLDKGLTKARAMIAQGAQILDVGGESTRPGADFVPANAETQRTAPVFSALSGHIDVPMSIDTRKADVAAAALDAGANWVNDVSALSFDEDMVGVVANANVPVCIMHAQGDPKTMQADPQYDDVVLDVYDYLEDRIAFCIANGVDRTQIIVDPGIGFGKTLDHNLELLRGLSLFHGLGCPILLGASRKRFIGTLTGTDQADERVHGSVAVALAAVGQGAQIVRVHDVAETNQALKMWMAVNG